MSLRTLLRRYSFHYLKTINFAPIAIQYQKHGRYERRDKEKEIRFNKTVWTIYSSVLVGSVVKEKNEEKKLKVLSNEKGILGKVEDVKFEAGERKPELPTFRAEEVSKHDSEDSFWVIYRHGVYDVTEFLPSHPGGRQIYNAAGLSIEPFWNVYGMHKTQDNYELLESYRIGNLHEDDIADYSDAEMWAREPARDPRLLVKTAQPFNAEIPPHLQVDHFDTPNELFYVRQHMPVPELEASSHKLRVEIHGDGGSVTVTELTMDQLQQFRQQTLHAALMCAGNRRSEMNQVKGVKGISWSGGAISNAMWEGVLLRDVLLAAGLREEDGVDGKHVILRGADRDATGEQFSTSIPLRLALQTEARVLLACRMNGRVLPRDHGHPLRAVVPGAPAVRSVKWLESITVSSEESGSHWHRADYRAFNPSVTWETADFSRAPPLYSLPVTSAFCRPADGDTVLVDGDQLTLKGYAYSGGGASIVRVDVSADRGRSWSEATLRAVTDPPREHYAWTLWTVTLPVPVPVRGDGEGEMELWVKATDSNFNTQPENFNDIWNIRGLLSNAYHKIKIKIKYNKH